MNNYIQRMEHLNENPKEFYYLILKVLIWCFSLIYTHRAYEMQYYSDQPQPLVGLFLISLNSFYWASAFYIFDRIRNFLDI